VTGRLSTTVTGPGTATVWWNVETLYGWGGNITFFRNGSWQTNFNNTPSGWRQETFEIPEGTHVLEWEYFTTPGSRGWMDQFNFSPSGSSSESFAEWAEVLPVDQRGGSDDPGGYGIPNLLRYAFGMDPIQPDVGQLPRVSRETVWINDDPETQLALTFTRRKDDSALQYTVEVSDNVMHWDPLHVAQQVIDDGNGVTETVIVRDSKTIGSQDKRFLRVKVGD
jgi:hypothetical protein